LPIDDDYYGIRRTLWIQTDKVYKAAGETYKNKIYILKRNNIPTDSLVPDFGKAPVSKLKFEGSGYLYNKKEWENRVREISAYFSKYPDIDDSGVSFRFAKVNTYLVNSEGTEVKSPVDAAIISVAAFSTASDGARLSSKIEVVVPTPNDIPANEWFKQEVDKLAKHLINLKNAETFNGNYTGPVMFTGQAASELIAGSLFSQEDPLIAIREPLYADRNMKIFAGNNPNSLETKLNKKVISNDLTVKALPQLKAFEGVKLIGHYDVDADGVVPPQEVLLVENGVLKSLLCDRTPTRMVPQSNGHRRFALFNGAVSYLTGPGVIEVSGKKQNTEAELKQKLIEKAKEEGLDFAILVKQVIHNTPTFPVEIYKVSVSDGKETLIRSAGFNSVSLSTLRKCIGTSNRKVAYNMLMSVGGNAGGLFGSFIPEISGLPVSVISPDALLIEEMEMEGSPKNLSEEKPIVPNPVSELIKK